MLLQVMWYFATSWDTFSISAPSQACIIIDKVQIGSVFGNGYITPETGSMA